MTVEYVDAGEAIDQGRLSGKVAGGEVAPPVVQNVDYERILQRPLRAPELAHLLRRLQRAAVQPAGPDQHGERQADGPRLGLPGRFERPHRGRVDLLVRGRPDRRRRGHVPVRLGRLVSGPSTRRRARRSGGTSTRSPSTCRCAAGT